MQWHTLTGNRNRPLSADSKSQRGPLSECKHLSISARLEKISFKYTRLQAGCIRLDETLVSTVQTCKLCIHRISVLLISTPPTLSLIESLIGNSFNY